MNLALAGAHRIEPDVKAAVARAFNAWAGGAPPEVFA